MRTVFFIFFIFLTLNNFSQEVTVLDKETGKTIKNVSIFNGSQTITLTTNNIGVADISSLRKNEIIFFSHISYTLFQVKKIDLKTKNYIVFLTKESEQLDEIILSVFKSKEKGNRIAEQILSLIHI